jgi:hypothetical protein
MKQHFTFCSKPMAQPHECHSAIFYNAGIESVLEQARSLHGELAVSLQNGRA